MLIIYIVKRTIDDITTSLCWSQNQKRPCMSQEIFTAQQSKTNKNIKDKIQEIP